MVAANLFTGKAWGVKAAATLGAFTISVIGLFGLLDMVAMLSGARVPSPAATPQDRFGYDAGLIVTSVAAGGFLFRPIRRDVAGFLPIDPDHPVHLIALVLTTLLVGSQITAISFTDVLAVNNAQPPLRVPDMFEDELPFLLAALAGVGLWIRRSPGASAARLGLVVPAWWHIALGLAAAGVFFGFGQETDLLAHSLTPQLAHRVDATTQHVFGQLDNPVGISAVALLPGLCEEILFRGALQPRIGLVATAVVFASIHTEYGLSIDTVSVLLIGLGLGLIRRYTNTTTSCLCHVAYNALVGIGISGVALNAAILIELVLVGATAYAIWARRRGGSPTP